MAKIEKWKTRLDPQHVFVFTGNRVVRNDGKVLHVTRSGVMNFSGIGVVVTAAEAKRRFDNMNGWERLP